jgi:thioredoxin 1
VASPRAAASARRPPATPSKRLKDPTTMSSELIKHVSDTSFEQDVLQSGHPVLVDFWAEWCGPCKMFAPILDEAAREYQGRLTVAKLDIDSNPATPGRYGIRGIPTVILYKDGQAHAQKVGAMSKSQLKAFLDSNL